MLGYPQLFPETATEQNCAKIIQRQTVLKGHLGFSHAEQNYMRQATSEANQLIAARVNATGVAEFVRVDGYFAGHEICGELEDPDWINAPTVTLKAPGKLATFKCSDQCFHPNQHGQKDGYSTAVNDILNPGPLPGLRFAAAAPAIVRAESNGSVTLSRRQVSCPAGATTCLVTTDAR